MVDYTQDLVDRLINCSKRVLAKPSIWKIEDGHQRRDLELESEDGEHRFAVFMRKNLEYVENYSIGLRYLPSEGGFQPVLVRCNGPHGSHAEASQPEHHRVAHVHKATAANISSGLRGERTASQAPFVDFLEALRFFVGIVNLNGADVEAHFPEVNQLSLW